MISSFLQPPTVRPSQKPLQRDRLRYPTESLKCGFLSLPTARALFAGDSPPVSGQESMLPHRGNQRICDEREEDLYSSSSDSSNQAQLKNSIELLNWRDANRRVETFLLHGYQSTPLVSFRAESGFICNASGDLECFCCHFTIPQWDGETDIIDLHEESRRNLNCRFLNGENCGNIPLGYRRGIWRDPRVQGGSRGTLTPNPGNNGSTSMPGQSCADLEDTPPRTANCVYNYSFYGQVVQYGFPAESKPMSRQGQGIHNLLTPPTTPRGGDPCCRTNQITPCCVCQMPAQRLPCGHSFACANCLTRFNSCPWCPIR